MHVGMRLQVLSPGVKHSPSLTSSTSPAAFAVDTNPGMLSTIRRRLCSFARTASSALLEWRASGKAPRALEDQWASLTEELHGFTGARFALGIRNSHDQTVRGSCGRRIGFYARLQIGSSATDCAVT